MGSLLQNNILEMYIARCRTGYSVCLYSNEWHSLELDEKKQQIAYKNPDGLIQASSTHPQRIITTGRKAYSANNRTFLMSLTSCENVRYVSKSKNKYMLYFEEIKVTYSFIGDKYPFLMWAKVWRPNTQELSAIRKFYLERKDFRSAYMPIQKSLAH